MPHKRYHDTSNKIDSSGIVRSFLAGFWEEDSTGSRIEFNVAGSELRLMGGGPGVYEFFSPVSFPLNGGTISWPHMIAGLKKMNQNSIEVTYTLFGGEPMKIKYKKVK
ncbi:MAG: hypothetical protein IPP38_14340 [Bacteroidetes bacterium]|nr:hypothetical protein [Bacteroidota bacterium]